MKPSRSRIACLCAFVAFIIAAHAAKLEGGGAFDKLRAAVSGASGWTEQQDKYLAFSPKELYGIIDGAATDYEKQGLKNGILVALNNGDKVLEIYFDDFGKPSRAKAMVEIKKKSMSEPKIIPNVNLKPAFFDHVLGGCIACWAEGGFYVEMTLTGYDAPEKAVTDAAALITVLGPVIGK
jgi:hypothetical protein